MSLFTSLRDKVEQAGTGYIATINPAVGLALAPQLAVSAGGTPTGGGGGPTTAAPGGYVAGQQPNVQPSFLAKHYDLTIAAVVLVIVGILYVVFRK